MDKTEVIDRLDRALAAEARSILSYLCFEADLLLAESSEEARDLFLEICATGEGHVAELGDQMMAAGRGVDLGPYPFSFMRYNFTTVDHVLGKLREGLEGVIRGLEEAAGEFIGVRPELEALLRGMVENRRGQVDRVRKLIEARRPAPPEREPPAEPPAPEAGKSAPASGAPGPETKPAAGAKS